MTLDSRLEKDISRLHGHMERDGKLLSVAKLKECYDLFRDRFGPEALRQLDGETLLNTMHAHGNRDSLVYWLEFKDDDELPARFGSIAGGSALKFGIYRSAETREWMTGSPQAQRKLTVPEAVERARSHRDQLLKGCELLAALPQGAADRDYAAIQKQMDEAAKESGTSRDRHRSLSCRPQH